MIQLNRLRYYYFQYIIVMIGKIIDWFKKPDGFESLLENILFIFALIAIFIKWFEMNKNFLVFALLAFILIPSIKVDRKYKRIIVSSLILYMFVMNII
ncbi:hypothetical protein NIES267_71360 (plasmid) [Calothrix parasitica NIES-267]|uniref:Uncharacterized protein n=1 Tax=Calothrix parasitica NIES-267 TaxID=1973488 RepID=A0A1Z4M2A4_9CYAN|nr:hypothetical protein NIES267_71360 [Calothrix parasitica NIES-267]